MAFKLLKRFFKPPEPDQSIWVDELYRLLSELTPGVFAKVLHSKYSGCVVETRIKNLYSYIITIVELRNAIYDNTPPITSETLLGPSVVKPLTDMFENDGWYLDPVPLVEEFREQLIELIRLYRNLPVEIIGFNVQYRSRVGGFLKDTIITIKGLLEYQESVH